MRERDLIPFIHPSDGGRRELLGEKEPVIAVDTIPFVLRLGLGLELEELEEGHNALFKESAAAAAARKILYRNLGVEYTYQYVHTVKGVEVPCKYQREEAVGGYSEIVGFGDAAECEGGEEEEEEEEGSRFCTD